MKNKLIQILLPLRDEKGKSFPQELYTELRSELTDKFGGITIYTRSPATGLWKNEKDDIEPDTIVIYEVIADDFDRKYWQDRQLIGSSGLSFVILKLQSSLLYHRQRPGNHIYPKGYDDGLQVVI